MIADWVTLSSWINPLTRKTCPNFPPFSSLPIPEERSLFTTKNPFIYLDSA
jgi:hypothetical protein